MIFPQIRWFFIDCQTTGMRPSSGELLELAWSWYEDNSFESTLSATVQVKSRLLKIAGGEVPRRISQITGIQTRDLEQALEPPALISEFMADLERLSMNSTEPVCVIHHAPFEVPFLKRLFESHSNGIPFRIVDSAKIAKRLLPRLPSCNLRALAGYFDQPIPELKRAGDHANATAEIWRRLHRELVQADIQDIAALDTWLQLKPSRAKKSEAVVKPGFEYSIDRTFRLQLPDRPGVYRMLASNGKILYVGKATSLRSRVNSYFRGQKGRDPKKLEMLTQVKNIVVTETDSPLEAALLENEEIKRVSPPYNVSLKVGLRALLFYDRHFASSADRYSDVHRFGPYRPFDGLERLRALADHETARVISEFPNLFFMPLETELMVSAFENFCVEFDFKKERLNDFRSTLAWAFWLARRLGTSLDNVEAESDEDEESLATEETRETVTERFARLFLSAARAHRQMFDLNRLLNCRVQWTDREGVSGVLQIKNGRYSAEEKNSAEERHAWSENGVVVLDRLSVLKAELKKQTSVKIERYHGDVIGNRVLHCEQI